MLAGYIRIMSFELEFLFQISGFQIIGIFILLPSVVPEILHVLHSALMNGGFHQESATVLESRNKDPPRVQVCEDTPASAVICLGAVLDVSGQWLQAVKCRTHL